MAEYYGKNPAEEFAAQLQEARSRQEGIVSGTWKGIKAPIGGALEGGLYGLAGGASGMVAGAILGAFIASGKEYIRVLKKQIEATQLFSEVTKALNTRFAQVNATFGKWQGKWEAYEIENQKKWAKTMERQGEQQNEAALAQRKLSDEIERNRTEAYEPYEMFKNGLSNWWSKMQLETGLFFSKIEKNVMRTLLSPLDVFGPAEKTGYRDYRPVHGVGSSNPNPGADTGPPSFPGATANAPHDSPTPQNTQTTTVPTHMEVTVRHSDDLYTAFEQLYRNTRAKVRVLEFEDVYAQWRLGNLEYIL